MLYYSLYIIIFLVYSFPSVSDSEESTYNAGELGSIPGLRRCPGREHGNPLQSSCLENPMDRGASGLQFLGSQSQTRLKQVSTHSGFSSVAQLCPTLVTPWIAALQAFLSFTISWSLLQLMSIESVMLSNHLILCHPLLLPSIFPSIRVF